MPLNGELMIRTVALAGGLADVYLASFAGGAVCLSCAGHDSGSGQRLTVQRSDCWAALLHEQGGTLTGTG